MASDWDPTADELHEHRTDEFDPLGRRLAELDDGPARSDAWSVGYSPAGDERVIRLRVENRTVALPALEAHKLGSALHAASGIDTCCGADMYWCPVVGRMECPLHGGFNVCCARPERHTLVTEFGPQATALLNWWRESRGDEPLVAEAETKDDTP
jgi:hypothetical protein